jgi:hypothetical protein
MIDFPASPTNGQIFTSGALSWRFDGTKWQAQGASSQYLVAFDIPGVLTTGAVFAHVFGNAVTFPINFSGSQARGSANATATPLITIAKAAAASPLSFSDIGTLTIGAGTVTPTFVAASAPSFAAGDTIRGLVTTGDTSFANLYLTLAGTRS